MSEFMTWLSRRVSPARHLHIHPPCRVSIFGLCRNLQYRDRFTCIDQTKISNAVSHRTHNELIKFIKTSYTIAKRSLHRYPTRFLNYTITQGTIAFVQDILDFPGPLTLITTVRSNHGVHLSRTYN